jgi:molybdenum cofactor guanylyltransferase
MGGRPKGLLPAPDGSGPLVVRSARLVESLGLRLALVGDATPYAALLLGVPALADRPPGVGPLGGLAALLEAAGQSPAIALACDMPYVTRDDLARLASFSSGAAICAGRRGDDAPWEPLFARYDPARVLPLAREAIARDERSLQRLLARAGAVRVPLASAATLDDWDAPEDLPPGAGCGPDPTG